MGARLPSGSTPFVADKAALLDYAAHGA